MSAPEAAEPKASASRPAGVRASRRAGRSGRAGRTILEKSGLPRPERGRPLNFADAVEWNGYLGPLVDRLGLGRPVPKWAIPHLVEAGHSHLVLLKLRAAERVETHPPEARRLRSEARRSASQRARCETVLAKMAAEIQAQQQSQVPSFQTVLAKVGRR